MRTFLTFPYKKYPPPPKKKRTIGGWFGSAPLISVDLLLPGIHKGIIVGPLTQEKIPEFAGVGEDLDDTVHEAGVAQVVQACEARGNDRHVHLLFVQWLYLGCRFLCRIQ